MCFSSIRMLSVICADWSRVAIPTFFFLFEGLLYRLPNLASVCTLWFFETWKELSKWGNELIKASAPVMGQETMWLFSCERATHTVTLKTTMNTGMAVYVPGHLSGSDGGSLGWQAARPAHSGPVRGSGQPLGLGCHTRTTFSLQFWHSLWKKTIH